MIEVSTSFVYLCTFKQDIKGSIPLKKSSTSECSEKIKAAEQYFDKSSFTLAKTKFLHSVYFLTPQ